MDHLQKLLSDGIQYDPRYLPSYNSDHLPMSLCALAGLGADFDTCLAYRERYIERLRKIQPGTPVSSWQEGLGRRECYASLLELLHASIVEQGIEAVASALLPTLIHGLPLDAFHPMIRLGYAIEFNSNVETAAALAYLVSSHQKLSSHTDTKIDLAESLKQQSSEGPWEFNNAGFSGKIIELFEAGDYPLGQAISLEQCARAALDIYRSTRDFFALHMVTGTHATRVCARFAGESQALSALAPALLAAHRVVGSPDFDRNRPLSPPSRLDDEHLYKFAWSCVSEFQFYGDERYAEEIRSFRQCGLLPEWCAQEVV